MKSLFRVLADDLTGACEIAALGHRRNLRSVVAISTDGETRNADLVVVDTDSRLDDPFTAEAKIIAAGSHLPVGPAVRLYKKTDSVLRGPVGAEVAALARTRGCARVLLLPANPSLGRLIRGGRYLIHDTPLDATEFGNDPHHPARSSDVCQLLRTVDRQPVLTATPEQLLPERGIIIGDVTGQDDFRRWLDSVDESTLAAGSAAFFDTLLDHWEVERGATPAPEFPQGPTLLLSGTLSPRQRKRIEAARDSGAAVESLPGRGWSESALNRWSDRVEERLEASALAIVLIPVSKENPHDPAGVRAAFAHLARRLFERDAVRHIVVEGGSTAAAVARGLGWSRLEVTADWGGGTVSLEPTAAPGLALTLKPGSYPWPPLLAGKLFPENTETASKIR